MSTATTEWGARRESLTEDSQSDIRDALSLLHEEGTVFEVFALDSQVPPSGGQAVGYFVDPERAAQKIIEFDRAYFPRAIYSNLNPIRSELAEQSLNELDVCTSRCTAADVVRRRWLLVDLDPQGCGGGSSSEHHLDAGHLLAEQISGELSETLEWPAPILCCSGNGWHLLYRVDLENDGASTWLIGGVLRELSRRFSNENFRIDTAVGNAASLTKCYGSFARKGSNLPDRPWRKSWVERVPERLQPITQEQLRALAPDRESRSIVQPVAGPQVDVRAYLQHYDVVFSETQLTADTIRFDLARCPFYPHSTQGGRDTSIFRQGVGLPGFHCFHDRCQGKTWRDVVAAVGAMPNVEFHLDNFTGAAQESGSQVVTPRDPVQMVHDLCDQLNDWPKVVDGKVVFRRDDEPVVIGKTSELFAELAIQLGRTPNFKESTGFVTKPEFLEVVVKCATQYEALEKFPHEPRIDDILYLHQDLPNATGEYLEAFLEFFTPATEKDADLIRALLLSTVWGGPPGSRPLFVIRGTEDDRERGIGVGKTTLAQLVARLSGGAIAASTVHSGDGRLVTRILSPAADGCRVVLMDNLKSFRLSSAEFESLVTAPVISGHRLYQGEARKPNNFTFCVTVNDPALSPDLADRAVIITLQRPDDRHRWTEEVSQFVKDHQWEIIADALQVLATDVPLQECPFRFQTWAEQVLCRASADAAGVLRHNRRNQTLLDDDQERAEQLGAFIAERIDRGCVFSEGARNWGAFILSTKLVAEMFMQSVGNRGQSYASVYKQVKQLVPHIPELASYRTGNSRGYVWRFADAGEVDNPVGISDTLERYLMDKPPRQRPDRPWRE